MAVERPTIIWFRRDLRLADNPALAAAADEGPVVPLFVDDPVFSDVGSARADRLQASLAALDRALRSAGAAGLVIRRGAPAEVVPRLAADIGARSVFVARDFTPYGRRRDALVESELRRLDVVLRGVGSPYVHPPGSVLKPDGSPYSVFTPFSRRWSEGMVDDPTPLPEDVAWHQGVASERSPQHAPIGEEDARDSLDRFVRESVAQYDADRDRPDLDGTSRLSAALKWGTIHPRTVIASLPSGAGPDAFRRQLIWRDFAADVLWWNPESAWQNLDRRYDGLPVDTGRAARAKFDLWCRGETGFGLVDAGMHELAETGWMHNRVRMVAASFLTKDLHLPWQWGARWFLDHLVDGDIGSNNFGWQWTAGSGSDAAPYHRVFNPDLQAERFDPDGAYVSRWAPEPHERMVDHAVERREALHRLDVMRDRPSVE